MSEEKKVEEKNQIGLMEHIKRQSTLGMAMNEINGLFFMDGFNVGLSQANEQTTSMQSTIARYERALEWISKYGSDYDRPVALEALKNN